MPPIVDIVKNLCAEQKISIAELEKRLGFSTSSVAKWDNHAPSSVKLQRVAEYFGVSVDYILGRSSIRDTADEIVRDDDIILIQRAKSSISEENWKTLMDITKAFYNQQFSKDSGKN